MKIILTVTDNGAVMEVLESPGTAFGFTRVIEVTEGLTRVASPRVFADDVEQALRSVLKSHIHRFNSKSEERTALLEEPKQKYEPAFGPGPTRY